MLVAGYMGEHRAGVWVALCLYQYINYERPIVRKKKKNYERPNCIDHKDLLANNSVDFVCTVCNRGGEKAVLKIVARVIIHVISFEGK